MSLFDVGVGVPDARLNRRVAGIERSEEVPDQATQAAAAFEDAGRGLAEGARARHEFERTEGVRQ